MDWKLIQEKYPKSWEAFCDSLEAEHIDIYNDDELYIVDDARYYDDRDLFDFFDSKGIILSVEPDTFHNNNNVTFSGTIWNPDEPIDKYTPECDSRIEAESAAFTRAFEILEQQLTSSDT